MLQVQTMRRGRPPWQSLSEIRAERDVPAFDPHDRSQAEAVSPPPNPDPEDDAMPVKSASPGPKRKK